MAVGKSVAIEGTVSPINEPDRKRSRTATSAGNSGDVQRSAMGESILPPGRQPLSAQCYPTPSPMDYNLQGVTLGPNAPKHSLHGRLYSLKGPTFPSPNAYDCSKDASWGESDTITLKAKQTTWPYDTRKNAHITDGPGSGGYWCRSKHTGMKRSLSARHKEGVNAGHPNPLVQPVDTHGFSTPGPLQFRPESVRGSKHIIANRLPDKGANTLGPGPASYSLPTPTPPTPLVGEILHSFNAFETPAPNTYTLPITSEQGKTFGISTQTKDRVRAPPPNTYYLRSSRPTNSTQLTLRPFKWKSERRPSPADYSPAHTDLTKPPQYSCREQCIPVFPDILLYPEHDINKTPGAGSYEQDKDFSDNSNPAYSVGLPLPIKPNANPSPNKYAVDHTHLSTKRTPPAYSMRTHVGELFKDPSPGPAAYNPKPPSKQGPSMTPRRKGLKGSVGPAPCEYVLETGTTHSGAHRRGKSASMKGQATPLQYSGFPSAALVRLQSLS